MTNESQALVWDAVFEPFGSAYSITGTATNNQRFPGQYVDSESGFSYNYFRDYDPTIGRYVQSDPIGLRGGINTFTYVSSNPHSYSDPLGLARANANDVYVTNKRPQHHGRWPSGYCYLSRWQSRGRCKSKMEFT